MTILKRDIRYDGLRVGRRSPKLRDQIAMLTRESHVTNS